MNLELLREVLSKTTTEDMLAAKELVRKAIEDADREIAARERRGKTASELKTEHLRIRAQADQDLRDLQAGREKPKRTFRGFIKWLFRRK